MEQPLVSIVLPTWQRHELLLECIEDIRRQTYKNIEIIVVCDGQDDILIEELDLRYHIWCTGCYSSNDYDLKLVMLGRNWSGLDPSSFGIAPLLVGYLAATGTCVMNWSDDDRALVPTHIEKLAQLIEITRADFVYSRCHIWRNGAPNNHENTIIGTYPPQHGQITQMLFRPENFVKFGYPRWSSHPVDWSLVKEWMYNGAKSAMLDEVTFEHRLDQ